MKDTYHNRTVDIYKVWELIEEMKQDVDNTVSFEDLLEMSDYKCKEHTVDVVVELYVKKIFQGNETVIICDNTEEIIITRIGLDTLYYINCK